MISLDDAAGYAVDAGADNCTCGRRRVSTTTKAQQAVDMIRANEAAEESLCCREMVRCFVPLADVSKVWWWVYQAKSPPWWWVWLL